MEGRGERLQEQSDLFSGLVWTGEESVPMGLTDAIGSPGYVAREVIGEAEIVDFTEKPDLLERLSDRIGVAMAKGMGELFAGGVGSPY
jgi:protease-4